MSDDPRILVAMGAPIDGSSGVPTVILGLTDATWADIDHGKAQDIDLRPLGVPATLIVMRGADHDHIKRQLQDAAASLEIPAGGLADLSVPKPKVN